MTHEFMGEDPYRDPMFKTPEDEAAERAAEETARDDELAQLDADEARALAAGPGANQKRGLNHESWEESFKDPAQATRHHAGIRAAYEAIERSRKK